MLRSRALHHVTARFGTPVGAGVFELFSLMAPLLLIVFSIGAGASAIAGEEDRHTLELLLANPVSRCRIVLEKLAALVAGGRVPSVATSHPDPRGTPVRTRTHRASR